MKLGDYLALKKPSCRLYIGSKSAFFFIGTLDEIDMLRPICKSYYQKFKKCYEVATGDVKKYNDEIDELTNQILEKKHNKEDYAEEDEDYGIALKNLHQAEDRVIFYEKALATFLPFEDRDVVYIYKKDTMADEIGLAIKIKGFEEGKYWTYGEWLNDKH